MIDAQQALAWAYLQTGSTEHAEAMIETLEQKFLERQRQGYLHLSDSLFLFAQNAILTGDAERTFERLQEAARARVEEIDAKGDFPRRLGQMLTSRR